MQVWGVFEGLHGYMPNYSAWYRTKDEAIADALSLKDGWLEMNADRDESDPYREIKVTGNIRKDLGYDVHIVNHSWDAEQPDPVYKDSDVEGHNKWVSWQYISVEQVEMDDEEWKDYEENGLDY